MVELIIIKKYLHEFHDGAILAIERKGQEYIFSLESAEMDRSDMKDGLSLSERRTIKTPRLGPKHHFWVHVWYNNHFQIGVTEIRNPSISIVS